MVCKLHLARHKVLEILVLCQDTSADGTNVLLVLLVARTLRHSQRVLQEPLHQFLQHHKVNIFFFRHLEPLVHFGDEQPVAGLTDWPGLLVGGHHPCNGLFHDLEESVLDRGRVAVARLAADVDVDRLN